MQSGSDAWLVNGLRLFVHRFRDESTPPSGLTCLLLHGFLDAGSTWDLTAERLARAGHEVLAPDLRGFGKSEWIGAGGYYHFPDYVADVASLVDQMNPERLVVVGHSMGGSIATLYTATAGDRVEKLALLEGVGPPSMASSDGPGRVSQWLRDLRRIERVRKPLASMADAVARLAANNPMVPEAVLESRARLLTQLDERGRLVWSYDPLHRTTSPSLFKAEDFRVYLAQIKCPTLSIGGGPAGYHPPDEGERLASLRDARHIELPSAGHMMHWTEPASVASALLNFFDVP